MELRPDVSYWRLRVDNEQEEESEGEEEDWFDRKYHYLCSLVRMGGIPTNTLGGRSNT